MSLEIWQSKQKAAFDAFESLKAKTRLEMREHQLKIESERKTARRLAETRHQRSRSAAIEASLIRAHLARNSRAKQGR